MEYLRFNLDLAIAMPLPPELEEALPAIKTGIRKLRTFAERINEGQPNEEASVRAVLHICGHGDGTPCGEEQDI